jgi:hypothetical protein
MGKGSYVPKSPPPYKVNIIPNTVKEVVSMMFLILGYDHDNTIDKNILGFMETIPPPHDTLVKLNYAQYIENKFICSWIISTQQDFSDISHIWYT